MDQEQRKPGRVSSDDARQDEAEEESFPASDPPATSGVTGPEDDRGKGRKEQGKG